MGPISPDSMFSNSSRERYFDKKDNGNYQNGRPSEMEPLTELPSNDDRSCLNVSLKSLQQRVVNLLNKIRRKQLFYNIFTFVV